MNRSDAKPYMKVVFGRENGEKTLAEIIKINPKRAKCRTLEHRGWGRGSTPGTIWNVDYNLLRPATQAEIGGAGSGPVAPEVLPVPLGDEIRLAGHHWLAEYTYDGHFLGFRVLQWQPAVKLWCHSGQSAMGRSAGVTGNWRYCQPCPMPELKLPSF